MTSLAVEGFGDARTHAPMHRRTMLVVKSLLRLKIMEVMVDTQAMDMAREKLKVGSEAMYMKRERLKQKLWLWRLYRVSQKNAPVACCYS